MNYNFDFDEADIFAGTQFVTDEHIDQLARPLPTVSWSIQTPVQESQTQAQRSSTPVQGHAMGLPTPPPSSERSVTPPPEQTACAAAPAKSRAKAQKHPKEKAVGAIPTQPKTKKNPASRQTPPHIAKLSNVEIFDKRLSQDEAKKIMGERLLEFLVDYRECDLKEVTGENDHSRIAHAKERALKARAAAQGRTYEELLAEFNKVSRSGRDKAEKAANAAAKKRSAADADVDDGEVVAVKKARKTPVVAARGQSEEAEIETGRSESMMRDFGYGSAATGGQQPYVSPYDHETEHVFKTDPIYNLAATSNLIWNNVVPFNARHDELAACIDHSCAEGNGFSRLCSEAYLASIGLSGPTNNTYVSNNYSLPSHSHVGTQTHGWGALDAAANELFPGLSRTATDAQIYDTGFLTNGGNNFAMLATNQVSQAQGARPDLAVGIPSAGAVSSQHMIGPMVGSNEFAAHRPADIGYGNDIFADAAAVAEQEMSHDEALVAERERGFQYGVFDTVSEIDAFDFDGALYGDDEDFFGGPPLFE